MYHALEDLLPSGKKLVSRLRSALAPIAEKAMNELLEMKRKEYERLGKSTEGTKLYFWDRKYYQRQIEEMTSTANVPGVEYFELNTTLAKLLNS